MLYVTSVHLAPAPPPPPLLPAPPSSLHGAHSSTSCLGCCAGNPEDEHAATVKEEHINRERNNFLFHIRNPFQKRIYNIVGSLCFAPP